jgi:HAD superfamily hydrolase (TIGR01509 family)
MIRWLFFDVGNVILNDDPVMAIIYKWTYDAVREAGHSISFEDFLRERERLLTEAEDMEVHRSLAIRYLGIKGYRKVRRAYHRYLLERIDQVYPLLPAILPVLMGLGESYRLALLANQPAAVEALLTKYGVWHLFERHFISEVVELRKPDPEFFRYALSQVDCQPDEAIMVGDRRDNDIIPARSIGMYTLWFSPPVDSKGYTPKTEWEKAFFESLRRVNHSDRAFRSPEARPDYVARSFEEIRTGVEWISERVRKSDVSV